MYVLRISVDKCNEYGLTLELARSRRFHTKKITDADYADNLALLSDNSYNAQKLLHILEQSAAFIGLHRWSKREGQDSQVIVTEAKMKLSAILFWWHPNIVKQKLDDQVRTTLND